MSGFFGLKKERYFKVTQCYDRIFVPHHRMPIIHSHHGIEIMYVLSGTVCVNLYADDMPAEVPASERETVEQYNLYPGDFIFLESRKYHDILVSESGARMLNVEISQVSEPLYSKHNSLKRLIDGDANVADFVETAGETFRLYDDEDICNLILLIVQRYLSNQQFSMTTDLLLSTLFADIAALYMKNTKKYRGYSYVRRAVFIIENCLGNISTDALSSAVGISSIYMRMLFKECFGLSVFEYINEYKVRRACSRIRNYSNIKLSELARELHFSSLQSFERVFVRHMGVTPAAYREKIKKSRNLMIGTQTLLQIVPVLVDG